MQIIQLLFLPCLCLIALVLVLCLLLPLRCRGREARGCSDGHIDRRTETIWIRYMGIEQAHAPHSAMMTYAVLCFSEADRWPFF